MDRINLALLIGGQSAEHEVSLLSALNILRALDKEKYLITLIGIDKQGHWELYDPDDYLLQSDDPKTIHLEHPIDKVVLLHQEGRPCVMSVTHRTPLRPIDVIFPILHGTYGEDGSVQGLCELIHLPFVGAGVLGSAIGMDKDVMKRLLRDAAIATAKFHTLYRETASTITFEDMVEKLGSPLFVKPANLGSSVGVAKVKNAQDWTDALYNAFQYGEKILVEEALVGREIECAVLGGANPIASIPGEVILGGCEFHCYASKYFQETGSQFLIPANLLPEQVAQIQALAIHTYRVLCCEGCARVDCFLTDSGEFKVIEINTLPGFTSISGYPKLLEVSGLNLSTVIDQLIRLALERKGRTTTIYQK
jgi:D-alanine-D-alanine ligase